MKVSNNLKAARDKTGIFYLYVPPQAGLTTDEDPIFQTLAAGGSVVMLGRDLRRACKEALRLDKRH